MKNMIRTTGEKALETSRTIYFAGMGVAASVAGRYENVFNNLVEAGRTASEKRDASTEKSEPALVGKAKAYTQKASDMVTTQITGALSRVGVPSQTEIRELTQSIERLTEKVQGLQAKNA